MQKKIEGNIFVLCDNCDLRGCLKLTPFRREYLSSAVNVLTSSVMILHITKTDFFKLNCLRRYQ